MALNPHDPRIKKTRRDLRAAFVRLILQKGYDAISIQDIADEAQTARITFYRHYKDKEELITDCLNELYEELVQKTEQDVASGALPRAAAFQVFYEHLAEQEQLYRILFSSLGAQTILNRIRQYLAQQILKNLSNMVPPNQRPPIPDEIIAYHLVNAHLGLGMWWLENNKPYPVDYMAQVSMWLSFAGLLRALGVEEFQLSAPTADYNSKSITTSKAT